MTIQGDAVEEAMLAYDPPGDAPRMWCETPPPDVEQWLVSDQLLVDGWAFARGGATVESVEIEVEGAGRWHAHHGYHRVDVAQLYPEHPGADAAGWRLRMTTENWSPGDYALRVTVRDTDARETSVLRRVQVDPASTAAYADWLERRAAVRISDVARSLGDGTAPGPAFAVAVVGGDAAERARTAESLAAQRYPNHELLDSADVAGAVDEFLLGDADHVVLVRAGDVVEPHALLALADAFLERVPHVLYADSDVAGEDGTRIRPFFKPGWSPELLLGTDYVGPFAAFTRFAAGVVRDRDDVPPRSIYDLMLRVVDTDLVVERISDVLYTRASAQPVDGEAAAREALEQFGRRRGIDPEIEPASAPGTRSVGWPIRGNPLVSIVIATAFKDGLIWQCLRSLARGSYRNFETILVVSDAEAAPEWPDDVEPCRIVEVPGPFNYSAVNNAGARAALGEYFAFLNDDVEIDTVDWLERLLEHVQQPGVGISGAKLVFPDGTLQLGGVLIVDDGFSARPIGLGMPADDPGPRGMFAVARDVSAVGGAAMLLSADLFAELDGFDERLAVELGDVDICLRAHKLGQRVVWTPRAVLRHHERSSRGWDMHPRDHAAFQQRWSRLIKAGDPYYNPNLDRTISHEYQLPRPRGPRRELLGVDHVVERFVPELSGGNLAAEHLARYHWAATIVRGKAVLDAGCGVGYGSEIFVAAGASVTGVDVSEEAVDDAQFRAGKSVDFRVADVRRLPFEDASFDVVACFETIEHVQDSEGVLDELRRVLRPDGVLLVSTPNRDVYGAGNPFHIHEYTPAELGASLERRFRNVALHRQQDWHSSLIVDEVGFGAREAVDILDADVRKLVGAALGNELYTIGVASDADLPAIPGLVVLAEPIDIVGPTERVRALEGHLELSVSERQRAIAAREELAAEHARLVAEHARVMAENAQLAAERDLLREAAPDTDAEDELAALQDVLVVREAAISRLRAALAGQRRTAADLRAAVDSMQSSASWRATAPLRAAKRLGRRRQS